MNKKISDESSFLDCNGNAVRAGDFVSYPSRKGSWLEMKTSLVKSVGLVTIDDYRGSREYKQIKVYTGPKPGGFRETEIMCTERTVLVPIGHAKNNEKLSELVELAEKMRESQKIS